MKNHSSPLTLSPSDHTVSFGSEKPNSSCCKTYHWSYEFNDGSRLVGTVKGQLDRNHHKLLNPTKISADYLDADGKTVLQSWKDLDFACFESDLTGKNLVIVASNDNFVGNSMCLVETASRQRAQVTDEGQQLIAESFDSSAWSMLKQPKEEPVSSPTWEVDWQVFPLFPFLSIRLNWRLPASREVYRWTFFPYCFPFPVMEVATRVSS
ncbi:hypothetical protein [Gloeothece verrucosa]|uniref:Uncharacterized protein n=1 Tax=Gloeothece verrucosa (strain PCC 7822) TaxID=497965 RepID=E0U858_GLOV7|nr:hypothetical protein [Gloeothece verrucosa]ADN17263.1 hypothetical protein Cyan7822_5386 [Gloeothece verrucosa PCC 7822]